MVGATHPLWGSPLPFSPHHEMRQSERVQRRVFKKIGDAAQHAREQRAPSRDLIIAGIDLRMCHDFAIEACEQGAQVAPAIRADVWGEFAAEGIGKIANAGDVAKDVMLAKIRAVRFKGVQTIRSENNHAAAAFCDAVRLADRLAIIVNMLDDFVQQHGVECVFGEWQRLGHGDRKGWP